MLQFDITSRPMSTPMFAFVSPAISGAILYIFAILLSQVEEANSFILSDHFLNDKLTSNESTSGVI